MSTSSETQNNLDKMLTEAVISATSERTAQEACRYARAFILKGYTQLAANSYDAYQRRALYKAVKDLRISTQEYPLYSVEIDKEIQFFNENINKCKKFSLGNCHEMALMALDYVIRYASPSLNAEVYRIKGGDHVFLVVGRKKGSNPKKPLTWGKDAWICDPWSNKVYPASEYLSQTKNYYFSQKSAGDFSNHLEDFNQRKHELTPIPFQNAEYLRTANSRPHLDKIIALFQKRIKNMINTLEKLDFNLNAIINRLAERYPDNPEKKAIIGKIQYELHLAIEKIKKGMEKDYTVLSYDTLRSSLEDICKEDLCLFRQAVHLDAADKAILAKYYNEESYITKALRFFKILPKTARDTAHSINTAYQQIEKIFKNK